MLRFQCLDIQPNQRIPQEVQGKVASLTILSLEEQLGKTMEGSAMLVCHCQKALKQAFKSGPLGIRQVTQDELEAHKLAIQGLHETTKTGITPNKPSQHLNCIYW
jgi:hypothetical protein